LGVGSPPVLRGKPIFDCHSPISPKNVAKEFNPGAVIMPHALHNPNYRAHLGQKRDSGIADNEQKTHSQNLEACEGAQLAHPHTQRSAS
jgi:hypothetical protein